MKGSEIDEELKNAEYAIKELGGEFVLKDEFELPDSDIKRNIIIVKKSNILLRYILEKQDYHLRSH